MKFRLMLWYMARRMELLARTNADFIAKLHGRDFTLQISSDEGTHRYFRVHRNRVHSDGRVHDKADLTLHFATNDAGLRLLSKGNAATFMDAMQKQDVRVVGDYQLLMWFMSIGKYLRPGRRANGAPPDAGAARSTG